MSLSKEIFNQKCEKIIIMEAGGIGDMVMPTPTLRSIRNRFSDSYIVLLTVPRSAEVIKDLPYFDRHICFNQEGFRNKYSLS